VPRCAHPTDFPVAVGRADEVLAPLTVPSPRTICSPRWRSTLRASFLFAACHLLLAPSVCSPRQLPVSPSHLSARRAGACHPLTVPPVCSPRQLTSRRVSSTRRAAHVLTAFHSLAACHRLNTSHLFAAPSYSSPCTIRSPSVNYSTCAIHLPRPTLTQLPSAMWSLASCVALRKR
jgi:hypothetical protein